MNSLMGGRQGEALGSCCPCCQVIVAVTYTRKANDDLHDVVLSAECSRVQFAALSSNQSKYSRRGQQHDALVHCTTLMMLRRMHVLSRPLPSSHSEFASWQGQQGARCASSSVCFGLLRKISRAPSPRACCTETNVAPPARQVWISTVHALALRPQRLLR